MHKKIKICGVKDPKVISVCNDIGIDFVGFNFTNKSPRKITSNFVYENDLLKFSDKTERVAVFVDPSDKHIYDCIRSIDATYIQLHGNESTERCSYIKNKFDLPIIKAFGIKNKKDLESALFYEGVVDYFLFDAKQENAGGQKGGLNKVFDWKILQEWKGKEFFLAGGININNIKLAMMSTNAFCIDISSGVETMLGVKDTNMIKEIYREFKTLE
tara:strand:+ start:236 stop:880 length:645 start_codon:yes stop_codon:yes gene_type:complete